MKKIGLVIMVVLLGVSMAMAQGRGQGNFNPEEMAKKQTADLKERLELDKSQEEKVYELNLKAAKDMQKMRSEMQNGGDREGMRSKMGALRTEQNKELKKILSEDQYKKYEAYLEERRNQRQGGGRSRR